MATEWRKREGLEALFESETVVQLPAMQEALGVVSAITVGRQLKRIPYRCSYNHNGRYYTLHDPARYDRFGLWSVGDIHFSVDGSLRDTVRRLVHESDAGMTHHELLDRLRVRVQNTLLDLLRKREVDRERLVQVYVYLHTDSPVRERQLRNRRKDLAVVSQAEVSDHLVIQVLLTVIRHPGVMAADVARHLRGHSPPISLPQIEIVFARYALGEKGGASIS
jgi:hypothetical protein